MPQTLASVWVAAADDTRPSRSCPSCCASSAIGAQEALWPVGWQCPDCGFYLPRRGPFSILAPELDEVDEGFDLQSFQILEAVEDGNFWFVSRNELIEWLVGRFSPDAERVLEIGCGTGFALFALRNALKRAKIVGSELHSRGLQIALQRHGTSVELLQMDARQSYLSNVFDLIGAFDVLEHIPDDEAVLTGIFKMLRPGGKLIATVPQHPGLWSRIDELAHHQRRYRVRELASKAERAGFETIYQTSFVTLAFPLMAASRFVERQRRTQRSLEEVTSAEFGMSPMQNRLLLALCRMEHGLRRMGSKLPFGGSQVVVARRPMVT